MTPADGVGERVRNTRATADRLLVVVAGPNGAGKSTFVDAFLRSTGLHVVNPDQIAKALAPDDPNSMAYQAAQAADTVRHDLVARGVSFCMETVFSDPEGAKLAFLRQARAQHYVVLLVFIGLDTGELAIARVVERVAAGGHDVPDDKILSRIPRTLQNLTQALEFVDHGFLFDNSSAKQPFRFVAEFSNGAPRYGLGRAGARPCSAAERCRILNHARNCDYRSCLLIRR
jgi:predicted ABC-type ATPase